MIQPKHILFNAYKLPTTMQHITRSKEDLAAFATHIANHKDDQLMVINDICQLNQKELVILGRILKAKVGLQNCKVDLIDQILRKIYGYEVAPIALKDAIAWAQSSNW